MSKRERVAHPRPDGAGDDQAVLAAGALVLAIAAVYANSLRGVWLLDDSGSILANPSIRHAWRLSDVLHPPSDAGVGGRPLANLTFALNFAFGGLDPRGYHVVNILIHAVNALLLFGLVRRTLLLSGTTPRDMRHGTGAAFVAALLWAVHPLLTGSVTYISQRTELLMTSCYLGTLYCFLRSASADRSGWRAAAVVLCAAGMAIKEVMVTAPIVVLLFDVAVIAGGWREAWQRRKRFYLALACTWAVLAMALSGLAARAVGLGLGVSPIDYALTQCRAVVTYLRLSLWPSPLIFDRGAHLGFTGFEVAIAVALVAGSILLWWRNRRTGFFGVCFFVLLAPTSSLMPIVRQPIAENRMYLPLAVAMLALALATIALLGRKASALLLVAFALAGVAIHRNRAYSTAKRLWADTVAKQPDNARAHDWLGMAEIGEGDAESAIRELREAVRLDPANPQTRNNFALALAAGGRIDEAIAAYNDAIRLRPDFAEAHSSLGYLLIRAGRKAEARQHLETAIRLQPNYAAAYNHLGLALPDVEAVDAFAKALALQPDFAEAENNLGVALIRLGRREEAIAHFARAVQLKPGFAEAQANLAHAQASGERVKSQR